MQLPSDDKVKPFLDGLKALGDKAVGVSNPERFLEAATRGSNETVSDEVKAIYTALGSDARFKLSEPEEVVSAVKKLLSLGRIQGKANDLLEGDRAHLLDALSKQVGSDDHIAHFSATHSPTIDGVLKHKTPTPAREASFLEKYYTKWSKLSSEHQINAGLFGGGAIWCAFSSIRNASHAVFSDADGSKHVAWSNVTVSALQALLSIGLGCMAAQAVRTGHSH